MMLPVNIALQILIGPNLAVGVADRYTKGDNVNRMVVKQTDITCLLAPGCRITRLPLLSLKSINF